MLVRTYLNAFAAVPQYEDFEIPKHHCIKHLRKYLELHGPFRQYWCMSYEAFIQLLKKMFDLTNYISAAHHTMTLWADRRATQLERAAPARQNYEPCSEIFQLSDMRRAQQHSELLQRALSQPDHSAVHAAQILRSVKRGTQQIRVGDWLLVSCGSAQAVMRVVEIAQLWVAGSSLLRMHCRDARHVSQMNQLHARIVVDSTTVAAEMLIRCEAAAISVLQCMHYRTRMEFRYSF